MSQYKTDSSNKYDKKPKENYVIEGVPYIYQEVGQDCELASFSMLVNYIEKKFSFHDIFYFSGAGYALGYRTRFGKWPYLSSIRPNIIPGSLVSIWEKDWEFISSLVGVKCDINYVKKPYIKRLIDEKKAWEEYWNRVKTYIKQDLPVMTFVDASLFSWYKKRKKADKTNYPWIHAIILVGYNENDGTFFYNDPYPGYLGYHEEGKYRCEKTNALRSSVYRAMNPLYVIYRNGYCTIVTEKDPNSLSKREIYKKAHERNISKMNGDSNTYDKIFLNWLSKFGIRAIQILRKDLKPVNSRFKLPILSIIKNINKNFHPTSSYPLDWVTITLDLIVKEKQLTSKILKKNLTSCKFCKYDSILLDKEAQKWKEILLLWNELKKSFTQNSYTEFKKEGLHIFQEIKNHVDEITNIENKIIKQNF